MLESAHTQRALPAAWAIAVSLALHALGFSAVYLSEWHAPANFGNPLQDTHPQASSLAAHGSALEAHHRAALALAYTVRREPAGLHTQDLLWLTHWQPSAPKASAVVGAQTGAQKDAQAGEKLGEKQSAKLGAKLGDIKPAQASAAALPAEPSFTPPTTPTTQAPQPPQRTQAGHAIEPPAQPQSSASDGATHDSSPSTVPIAIESETPSVIQAPSPPPLPLQLPSAQATTAPVPVPAAAPTQQTAAAPSYRLPSQLRAQFDATVRGFAGKSVLTWKTKDSGAAYEAQLISTVAIPFKTFEHRFESKGVINDYGLAPLSVLEKRPSGGTVATTIEPVAQRVVISSKEGFLPYDPRAHDLVSLMVQLAVYAQTQPRWQTAGTAQDFTVYRPSGIKRWRFQSMGVVLLEQGTAGIRTVHVRRVALGTEPDYEDQYHFWLDLSRYGFPVKIRQVDHKGNTTDIQLVDWRASE